GWVQRCSRTRHRERGPALVAEPRSGRVEVATQPARDRLCDGRRHDGLRLRGLGQRALRLRRHGGRGLFEHRAAEVALLGVGGEGGPAGGADGGGHHRGGRRDGARTPEWYTKYERAPIGPQQTQPGAASQRAGRRTPRSAASRASLTARRNSAAGLNTGTYWRGTSTGSSVWGFRAVRAFRRRARNVPNPRSSTSSPDSTASTIVSMNPSTTASVSSLVSPVAVAMRSTICALVTSSGRRCAGEDLARQVRSSVVGP